MAAVLRFTLLSVPAKRLGRRLPIGWVLMIGEISVMAGRHLARLDAPQRRRLVELLRKSSGRPSSLSNGERDELRGLIDRLEPRLFLGSAIKRLSPAPLPKRLLYGRRGSAARKAASKRP